MATAKLPINLSPNFTVIDATQSFQFTWESSSFLQYGYQLLCYESTGALIINTGTVVSQNQYLNVIANTLTNNKTYVWILRVYKAPTDFIDTSYTKFFTRTQPTVTLTATPTAQQNFNFQFSYTLSTSSTYKKFKANLYNSDDVLINTSGWLYNTETEYEFGGFLSGDVYKIEGIVEDQTGLQGTSGLIPFTVTYTTEANIGIITAISDDCNAVMNISWERIVQIIGVVNVAEGGTYSYVTGKYGYGVLLDLNTTLTYDNLYADVDNTLTFYANLSNGTYDIVEIENNYIRIFVDNGRIGFEFDNGATFISSELTSGVFGEWTKFAFVDNKLIIQSATYEEIIG